MGWVSMPCVKLEKKVGGTGFANAYHQVLDLGSQKLVVLLGLNHHSAQIEQHLLLLSNKEGSNEKHACMHLVRSCPAAEWWQI